MSKYGSDSLADATEYHPYISIINNNNIYSKDQKKNP